MLAIKRALPCRLPGVVWKRFLGYVLTFGDLFQAMNVMMMTFPLKFGNDKLKTGSFG